MTIKIETNRNVQLIEKLITKANKVTKSSLVKEGMYSCGTRVGDNNKIFNLWYKEHPLIEIDIISPTLEEFQQGKTSTIRVINKYKISNPNEARAVATMLEMLGLRGLFYSVYQNTDTKEWFIGNPNK